MHDKILIVDFGSQVTQLIARRVREDGVYCEIAPFQKAREAFAAMKPRAVVLSGGPASVLDADAPLPPSELYQAGLPVLGICYGEEAMAHQLGGEVEGGHHREFGRAEVEVTKDCALFDGIWRKGERYPVWMSHGDRVTRLPDGFRPVATSPNAPIAAIADDERRFYATQFHLEVVHTPHAAALLHVEAQPQFRAALKGVTDPEAKRKTIGQLFIDVFEAEARKIAADGRAPAQFLAQGTLYPDVIESVSFTGGPSVTIKSHHNVGGLPERMNMKLVEPLRELFKDEVRVLGRELGLPEIFVGRHPFPGPGLAIRCPSEITREKLDILRNADAVYIDQIRKADLYDKIWQAFAVLLPVKTVSSTAKACQILS